MHEKDNQGAATPPPIKETEDLGTLRESLTKCEKQSQEYLDGWKRTKADFINYKKEEALRLQDFIKFGNESLIHELIGVLDSFNLAKLAAKNETEVKELLIIMAQFEDILRKFGLEKVVIEIGGQFDPSRAEAVSEVESDKPAGTVVEEVSGGYVLSGKVIRPARVKLSKGPK